MKLKPLYDRIVVKRLDKEEKSAGGIIIPDSAKEKPMEAEVVSVGDGKRLESGDLRALDVKVGDKVLFGKYAGTELKISGDEVIILSEDEVLAIIED
jgi:chaperonin GroES